jgi:hypothetical protein
VSEQPAAGSSALTLAALRQARASREALLRRILPVGLGALVIVVVTTPRATPGAGLHGASLGVTPGPGRLRARRAGRLRGAGGAPDRAQAVGYAYRHGLAPR